MNLVRLLLGPWRKRKRLTGEKRTLSMVKKTKPNDYYPKKRVLNLMTP